MWYDESNYTQETLAPAAKIIPYSWDVSIFILLEFPIIFLPIEIFPV